MVRKIIACVLRSNGNYSSDKVWKLYHNIKKFTNLNDIDFICLSDDPNVPGYHALEHNFPTWWAKIELFKESYVQMPSRILYLDLDTVILGDLSKFFNSKGLYMLEDFNLKTPASGFMMWDSGTVNFIYEDFIKCKDPMNPIHKVNHHQKVYGDQSWIEKCLRYHRYPINFFQKTFKNEVLSWPRNSKNMPRGSVVCFYGKVKPWNCAGWAKELYDSFPDSPEI